MKKAIIALFLLLSYSFVLIGYANLTDKLKIESMATVIAPAKGIRITSVEIEESKNATDRGSQYFDPTNLNATVNAQTGGSITYKITVENNSDVTYWYRGISYLDNVEGTRNDLIGKTNGITVVTKDKLADSKATFDTEDWVPPHTVRDFYVIYTFGSNASGTVVSTLINFSFGGRITSYADEILYILNTPEKYAVISGAFNEAYSDSGSTVLANLGADKALFDELFGSDLTLDGKPVSIMIERSNMDAKTTGDSYSPSGPTGCEYTIYVTTDSPTGTPTVYAVSYTREANGQWVQIGELYEGTTPVGTYTDSDGDTYAAFNPHKWEAVPKTYTVFTYNGNSVTYKVNQKYGNSYQQQFTLDDLMSMKDQELYNQLNNHQILKDVYKILFKDHVGSTATEILLLREAYDDALRYYEMRNSGQEFSLNNNATRAELLATVEALAKAMDYYMQVHDTNHQ